MPHQHALAAQLWTVRAACQKESDLRRTLEKIAAIGYTAIEVAGLPPAIAPQAIQRCAQETGLRIISAHYPWTRFVSGLEAIAEAQNIYQAQHVAVAVLPAEYYTPEGLERFHDEVIPVSKTLAEAGVTLSYHNHSRELARLGATTWLEALFEKVPRSRLRAQLDTFWIQHGGGDPVQWICRFCGRQPMLHLKDMAITPEGERRMAEVGEGNLNWRAILQAAGEAGVDWYIVEQDETYGRDPIEALAVSYANLKALGLN